MSRRRAAVTVALLLFLAACGNGDRSSQGLRDSASSPAEDSTTTSAPATTPSSTARAATTTTRPTTTTTRAGVAATTTTTAAGPRAIGPAAPGTYRYDTTGSTTFGGNTVAFPAVTTLVADPPAGPRQHSTRNLRDASGNGVAPEFTLDYRPEGVFLVSLRLTTGLGGVTDIRDLQPSTPVLLLATGARPGVHMEADLTGTSPAKLVVDVLREERVTVGSQAVDTLVMRAVFTLGPGDLTGRQELTLNVDRSSGLWVRERSVADAAAGGGVFTLHSEYTATLQRLTP